MLFSNERKHQITLPGQTSDGSHPNIAFLLQYLVKNVMRDQRKELFILEDNVYVPAYVLRKTSLISAPDVRGFLFSSTTQTGSLKGRKHTSFSPAIILSSSPRYTVDRSWSYIYAIVCHEA